jgi:hypothetical protein
LFCAELLLFLFLLDVLYSILDLANNMPYVQEELIFFKHCVGRLAGIINCHSFNLLHTHVHKLNAITYFPYLKMLGIISRFKSVAIFAIFNIQKIWVYIYVSLHARFYILS